MADYGWRTGVRRLSVGNVVIDGREVRTEADLHRILERPLELGEYYGRNLAALRDRLLTDVPRLERLV
jgi:ribonuclease inhibitor